MKDSKKEDSPNLIGWAAVLTAVATVLTAIGFPEFFPSTVKQFLSRSSSGESAQDISFECRSTGSSLSTVVVSSEDSDSDPIINWDLENRYFGEDWPPEKRCQVVSERFQSIYERDQLAYLTADNADWESDLGIPVICSVPQQGARCVKEDLLFTLQERDDPNELLAELITLREPDSNKTILRAGAASFQDGVRVYYDTSAIVGTGKRQRF